MVAAVLVTLRRKQEEVTLRREQLLANLKTQSAEEKIYHPQLDETTSSPSVVSFEQRNRAASKIQSAFRGYELRRHVWETLRADIAFEVSGASVDKLRIILLTHVKGWNSLCWHALIVLVYSLMIFSQLFASKPSVYETQQALRHAFEATKSATSLMSYQDVRSSRDIYPLLRSLGHTMYRGDPRLDPNLGYYQTENPSQYIPDDQVVFDDVNRLAFTSESGYLDSSNRIQLGMIVRQHRREYVDCLFDTESSRTYTYLNEEKNITHRGCATTTEAVVYRSNHIEHDDLESTSSIFQYKERLGYVTVFDLGVFNVGLNHLNNELALLEFLRWVDEETSRLCIHMLLYNQNEHGRTTSGALCYEFPIGGGAQYQLQIRSTPSLNLQHQLASIVLTTVFVILWLLALATRIKQLRSVLQRKRKLNARLVLNFTILCLEAAVVTMYIVVLLDYNYFVENPNRRIELGNLVNQTNDFLVELLHLDESIDMVQGYKVVLGVLLTLYMWKGVLLLDFHENLAMVTRTITSALVDLSHFLVVFTFVVVTYAVIGHLILSDVSEVFRTVGTSLAELLLVAVGEFGATREAVLNQNLSNDVSVMTVIYLYSYIFLVTLLLLNVLLSIIVDAFASMQHDKRNTVIVGTFQSLEIWAYDKLMIIGSFCCCKKLPLDFADNALRDKYIEKRKGKSAPTLATTLEAIVELSCPTTTSLQLRRDLTFLLPERSVDLLVRVTRQLNVKEREERKEALSKIRSLRYSGTDEYLDLISKSVLQLVAPSRGGKLTSLKTMVSNNNDSVDDGASLQQD